MMPPMTDVRRTLDQLLATHSTMLLHHYED